MKLFIDILLALLIVGILFDRRACACAPAGRSNGLHGGREGGSHCSHAHAAQRPRRGCQRPGQSKMMSLFLYSRLYLPGLLCVYFLRFPSIDNWDVLLFAPQSGFTSLMMAAGRNKLEAVHALVSMGADLEITDRVRVLLRIRTLIFS